MASAVTPIQEYEKSTFAAATSSGYEISHDVYQRGSGAPVVVLQELPGIGVETLRLADELVDEGFLVVLPHLFGPIGKTSMAGNTIRVLCMRKEFHCFRASRTSPIVDWLKALCRDVRSKTSSEGVGVIGMCLTGNFAMSLMADESVLAAVASQPSMPFGKSRALHMSDEEVACLKARIDSTAPMKALRFEGDSLCSAAKFACIDARLNDGEHRRVELDTLPGKGHSVLTLHFVNEVGHPTRKALDDVLQYFRGQLKR